MLLAIVLASYSLADGRLYLLTFAAGIGIGAVFVAAIPRPSDLDGTIELEVANGISPGVARRILLAALRDVAGVRQDVEPLLSVARLSTSGITYRIVLIFDDDANPHDVASRALTRIWHSIQREGWLPTTSSSAESAVVALAALDAAPLFVALPADLRHEMASGAAIESWDIGERVVEQGTVADSCFIVRSGRLGVHVSNGDAEIQVATLQAGDLFGEMSLLTGQTRWATVRVEEEAELVRIRAAALKTALIHSPDLVQLLAESVATRRDQLLEARSVLEEAAPATLPDDIRRFLEISRERAQP